MRFDFRAYQKRAADRAIQEIFSSPLIVAPTGGGKTRIASRICRRLGGKLLWIAHRKELIDQARATLEYLNYRTTSIEGGAVVNPTANAIVATVQSFRPSSVPPVSLIVIDEAHHATSGSYARLFETRAPVLGLTATPFRMDGVGLGDLFGSLVVATTPAELVESGILHDPVVYAPQRPEIGDVRVSSDFNRNQLSAIMDKPSLVGDIVNEWIDKAASARTIAFAVDVQHSMDIVAAFTRAGIAAEHLDGKTPGAEREAILRRLATGETSIVSNVEVLTEGFDLPTIEAGIIARPTKSLGLHIQMIGRIIRAAEGKSRAVVLDHAGNHHRHGTILRPLEYDLSGKVRTAPTTTRLGLRTCPNCWRLYPVDVSNCPQCGEPWANKYKDSPFRTLREREGDLVEFEDRSIDYKRRVWEAIKDAPDARRIYRKRFGEDVVILDGELLDVKRATKEQKRRAFKGWEKTRGKNYAVRRYRNVFGAAPYWLTFDFKKWQRKKYGRRR